MKKALFILVITLVTLKGYSQDRHKIDSLKNELVKFEAYKKQLGSKATALTDSTKAIILINLSQEYIGINNDTAIYYVGLDSIVSNKIGFKRGIADAYNSIGLVYTNQKKYSMAVDYYQKSLTIRKQMNDDKGMINSYFNLAHNYIVQNKVSEAIRSDMEELNIQEKTGDKKGMATTYKKMGFGYSNLTNYPEGLKNFMQRLKIDIQIKDKSDMGNAYSDVGFIYDEMEDYPNALKNYLIALKINEELGNEGYIATSCVNLALLYGKLSNYNDALKSSFRALTIGKETKTNWIIEYAYIALGRTYYLQGNYTDALKNYSDAEKLYEEEYNVNGMAGNITNLGDVYEKQGNLQKALSYYLKGLSLIPTMDSKNFSQTIYKSLANIYAQLRDYKSYYNYEVLYRQISDSIYSKENQRKITNLQMQYNFDKQQDSTQAEQAKKDAITTIEIKNQKRIRNYVLGGLAVVLFFLVFVFIQRNRISKEKKRSENLLLNILPAEVADELKAKGSAEAKDFEQVTVMFTDFKDFTRISEQLSSAKLVAEINYCFSAFDAVIEKYGIEKIKTIGDSYMCAGGLPVKNITHPDDVVRAALDIKEFMAQYKKEREVRDEPPFEIRIGIHTGPVVAGIVGVKKFAYDIWGDTVNIASRMESSGEAGKINISGSTYEIVKDDFTCIHRGKIQAKNKGDIDMYFVERKIMT